MIRNLTFPGEVVVVELDILASQVSSGLRALQSAQTRYDADMWDIGEPRLSNVRHIQIHLAITVGKLARLVEPRDHQAYHGEKVEDLPSGEIAPILADLLIHAAQLANIQGLDLGDVLAERYRQNAARFAQDSPLSTFGLK